MSIGYEAFVKVECGICGEDVEVITTYDQMNEDKSKRFMISFDCYSSNFSVL